MNEYVDCCENIFSNVLLFIFVDVDVPLHH